MAVVALLAVAAACVWVRGDEAMVGAGAVTAVAETDQVRGAGDDADDPVVWVHPTDRSRSLVLGTNKHTTTGGLHVYGLDGVERQYLPVGALNNVDLRYGFRLGNRTVDLVGASNRTTNSIDFFTVNPSTRRVTKVNSVKMPTRLIYGFCMARSRATGAFYAIPNFKSGTVQQYELSGVSGTVTTRKVRSFDAGTQTEGCVSDDPLGRLYVGVEEAGFYRYGLDPASGATRTQVDRSGTGGNIVGQTEGITVYQKPNGPGYLIVSSQGDSKFTVYARRAGNRLLGAFRVVTGNGIDAVTGTDGLDVTNASLGPRFDSGLLVVHDNSNRGGSASNYKLVRWDGVVARLRGG